MEIWLWWLAGALVLGIAEMLTLQLVCLMLAGGALVGAMAAGLGAPFPVQIALVSVTSVLLLFALRPWLLRHWRTRVPLAETNAAALVGRVAVVVATTTELGGRIKLAGEVWTARSDEDDATYTPGTEVRVLRIEGATAVVGGLPAAHHPGISAPPVDA